MERFLMLSNSASPKSFGLSLFQRWGTEAVALLITLGLFATTFTPWDGYDWLRMHFWHKTAYQNAWISGQLHHWNPFVSMGRPALAEIEAAIFYPPNLVFLAGPSGGLLLAVWLHLAWLLRGMRRLMLEQGCGELGAWMAALTFAMGAPLLGRLQSGQVQVFFALAWLPFLLVWGRYLVRSPGVRPAVVLAGGVALALLAGSPPMMWIMGWALLGWILIQALVMDPRPAMPSVLGWATLSLVVALGLAAVQLLPFLELVSQGNRGGGGAEYVSVNSMAGQSWWSLLQSRPADRFFYWEFNLYGGVLSLVLALSSILLRRHRGYVWWGLGGVFAGLALGFQTPLLPLLVEWVPGWDAWRYPSRYAIITALAVAVLAGFGLDGLVRLGRDRWRGVAAVAVALVVLNAADLGRAYVERQVAYGHIAPVEQEAQLAQLMTTVGAQRDFPPRVFAPNWVVRENAGMQRGFSSFSGFANPALIKVWAAVHQAAGLVPNPVDPANLPNEVFKVGPAAFAAMALDIYWNPREEEFSLVPDPSPRALLEQGKVTAVEFTPDRIEISVTTDAPDRLRLAEPWYPGWEASVNGVPQEVELAAGWMRAVVVPTGSSEVVFTYRSRWLDGGLGLSLLTLLLASWGWRRARS